MEQLLVPSVRRGDNPRVRVRRSLGVPQPRVVALTEERQEREPCRHAERMMRSGGRRVMRCILCGRTRDVRAPFDPTKGIR